MSKVISTYLVGVRLDSVTSKEAIATVYKMIEEDQPGLIATVNAEFIVAAQKNDDFRNAINNSALALPDGSGPTILSRLIGHPLKERIPGVDLAENIMKEANNNGWRLFLLGGDTGSATLAAEVWQKRYPQLKIVGINEGSSSVEAAPEVVNQIKESRADIVMVCFSFPRQELWIHQNIKNSGAKVGIGLGGTFDYVSGKKPRAPKIFRAFGLEWFYRLITQPSRYKRMFAIPYLTYLALRYRERLSK